MNQRCHQICYLLAVFIYTHIMNDARALTCVLWRTDTCIVLREKTDLRAFLCLYITHRSGYRLKTKSLRNLMTVTPLPLSSFPSWALTCLCSILVICLIVCRNHISFVSGPTTVEMALCNTLWEDFLHSYLLCSLSQLQKMLPLQR